MASLAVPPRVVTENPDPNLIKLRKLSVLPNCRNCMTEPVDPILETALSEMEEPKADICRTLQQEPILA
jgi:hypothetical protein